MKEEGKDPSGGTSPTAYEQLRRIRGIGGIIDQVDLLTNQSNPNLNIIITGSPGSGKTVLARLLATWFRERGLLKSGHIIESVRADLVSGYVGQTAVKTREVLDRALGGVFFLERGLFACAG